MVLQWLLDIWGPNNHGPSVELRDFRIQTCMETKYKVQMLGYRNRKAAISASKYKGDIPSDKNMCFWLYIFFLCYNIRKRAIIVSDNNKWCENVFLLCLPDVKFMYTYLYHILFSFILGKFQ